MKKNMGNTDRVVRVAAAVVIGILYFMNVISGTLGTILAAIAVVFLLTSAVSFCPLYAPFGIKTRKT